MDEARLEEKRLRDEERAAREAQAGSAAAVSIQELLQRLSSPGHDILYYTGGIRLLAEVVSSCECLCKMLILLIVVNLGRCNPGRGGQGSSF